MRAVAVLGLALLAGCGDMPQARTESEIRMIAEDIADATAQKERARIEELENKVEELESEIRRLSQADRVDSANIDTLFTHHSNQKASIDQLYVNDKTFAGRLGIPFRD